MRRTRKHGGWPSLPSWIPNPFANSTSAEEMKLLNAQRTGTGIPLNGKNVISAQQKSENETAAQKALLSTYNGRPGVFGRGGNRTRNNRKHNRKTNKKQRK